MMMNNFNLYFNPQPPFSRRSVVFSDSSAGKLLVNKQCYLKKDWENQES